MKDLKILNNLIHYNMKANILTILFSILALTLSAQARLTIENNSQRTMTVKIMKGNHQDADVHETVTIPAHGSTLVYFYHSGYYFTKTKAVLAGKETVYQKGQPFEVINDDTGYSVMTLTFSITETTVPQVLGGKRITKTEYDQD